MSFIGPEQAVEISEQSVKQPLKNWSKEEHKKIWRELVFPRKSKMFITRTLLEYYSRS